MFSIQPYLCESSESMFNIDSWKVVLSDGIEFELHLPLPWLHCFKERAGLQDHNF